MEGQVGEQREPRRGVALASDRHSSTYLPALVTVARHLCIPASPVRNPAAVILKAQPDVDEKRPQGHSPSPLRHPLRGRPQARRRPRRCRDTRQGAQTLSTRLHSNRWTSGPAATCHFRRVPDSVGVWWSEWLGRPCHVLVGLPASGETTVARRIAADGSAVRFTLDEWMLRLHDTAL